MTGLRPAINRPVVGDPHLTRDGRCQTFQRTRGQLHRGKAGERDIHRQKSLYSEVLDTEAGAGVNS